ncbi:MAG TPA: ABC transporter permease [Gemmatimonadaceae bacterium]|nr:ABC transporter permease [Gemmatimonadaceae bacterium]
MRPTAVPRPADAHAGPHAPLHAYQGGSVMLGETLLMALREIRRNALRSFLTMLGVVIGVGAVIVLVTLGDGASAKVKSDIAQWAERRVVFRDGRILQEVA